MDTNTDQNTSPSKEKTEPTTAPASKDAKSAKNTTAKSKKSAYKIVGGCVAAALIVACIGFASCNATGGSAAKATPSASVEAKTLYANAKDVTLLDANGKETTDKITVATVKKADATQASLKDWYFNHVVKGGYKYGVLKFSDESGKGIYADSTGIYEGELKEDTATKGYTKPADTSLIYTVDTSKKTLDSAKKSESSATPKSTASANTAEAKEEKGDTAADTGSNTSSDSGKSGSSASQGSKPAGGSSNSSSGSKTSNTSGSSSKSQTCKTVHHDAVTHQETTYTTVHHDAVTTQQWVQDTAAWDEQVDTGRGQVVCGNCHQVFNTVDEVGYHIATVHKGVGNYWVEPVYETVHHDATGHYETVVTQAAYDEQVPSGTKTVVDQAAYDEQGCK